MKNSFEGIGQWSATFACDSSVEEGKMVIVCDNGKVTACGEGDQFCGVAEVVARDGEACAVVMSGMVTASYTGTVPYAGWCNLSADGNGGVMVDSSGGNYLVVDADTAAKKVTFVM